MGTKNNPGRFDCYHAAEPDEPMFVLLARDLSASCLIQIWAGMRTKDADMLHTGIANAMSMFKHAPHPSVKDQAKAEEADKCREAMVKWYMENRLSTNKGEQPK